MNLFFKLDLSNTYFLNRIDENFNIFLFLTFQYSGVTGDQVCNLPYTAGQGKKSLQRWYFDPMAKQCIRFEYRGLQGNQNNFLSIDLCKRKCQRNILQFLHNFNHICF